MKSKRAIPAQVQPVVMRISEAERRAIKAVLAAGEAFGYGNMIAHLNTAWARSLMKNWGMSEKDARASTHGSGYSFKMQDDLVERGFWDVSGKSYIA